VQSAPFSQIPDLASSGVELGQPHDLVHWHAFAAAAAGFAQPIDDLWEAKALTAEEYVPGALEDVTWDGQRYGVPLDINALVLMVNEASFERAGLELDDVATLAGFEQAAEQVVDTGASAYAITVSASSWAAYGWIVANGGQLLTRDADGRGDLHAGRPGERRGPREARRARRHGTCARTLRAEPRARGGRVVRRRVDRHARLRLLGPADRTASGPGGGLAPGHPDPAAAAGRPGPSPDRPGRVEPVHPARRAEPRPRLRADARADGGRRRAPPGGRGGSPAGTPAGVRRPGLRVEPRPRRVRRAAADRRGHAPGGLPPGRRRVPGSTRGRRRAARAGHGCPRGRTALRRAVAGRGRRAR
jgi:hypothetical protein